jgi:CheY-like chemotaxis protein
VSVLIVDDDDDICEILSEILVRAGYTVIAASNGAEALKVLESVRPSLILLDLNMPVMDGFELCRVRKLDAAIAEIPTVIMSALYKMRERIADLGVDDALAKPVQIADVLAMVRRYCGVARAA